MLRLHNNVTKVQDEMCQLILRCRYQLNERFVEQALARCRRTNEAIPLNPSRPAFTESEAAEFNLQSHYTFLRCSVSLTSSDGYEFPLCWYKYTTIHGTSGYILVEEKLGPYCHSENRDARLLEDHCENMRSIYGLVRQFRAANREYNDKFRVLSCRGFYYSQSPNNNQVFLVWDPPTPILCNAALPQIITLREALSQGLDSTVLKAVAKGLVKAVYELLQARWFHHQICANAVIAFGGDWHNPYLVGFRTARMMDGYSEPGSRHAGINWRQRYFQHPDRYEGNNPSNCRFRMKHEIFGLGVLLLELHSGNHFGTDEKYREWEMLDGESLRKVLVKYAKENSTNNLGTRFVDPIVHCLNGFDNVDRGTDDICHPNVLRSFRTKVFLESIMD
jgi:hypothetical protein